MSDNPDLVNAMARLADASRHAATHLRAMTAMGLVMQSKLSEAADILRKVDSARLSEISVAAATLSSLADETMTETGAAGQ